MLFIENKGRGQIKKKRNRNQNLTETQAVKTVRSQLLIGNVKKECSIH